MNGLSIDQAARLLLEEVDKFTNQLQGDRLRIGLQKAEAEKGLHALAVLEAIDPKLARLAVAHELLGAALNKATGYDPAALSMITLEPATFDGEPVPAPPVLDSSYRVDAPPAPPAGMAVQINGRFTADGLRSIANALEQGRGQGGERR